MKVEKLYKCPWEYISSKLKPVFSKQKTLECSVCHEKIKKGDIYVEVIGEEKYVCLTCDMRALAELGKAVDEGHPIASLDEEYEEKPVMKRSEAKKKIEESLNVYFKAMEKQGHPIERGRNKKTDKALDDFIESMWEDLRSEYKIID